MAQVRLARTEAKNNLPDICVVCGAPATVRRVRRFTWGSLWYLIVIMMGVSCSIMPACGLLATDSFLVVGVISLGIISFWITMAVFLISRVSLRLPFCNAHNEFWAHGTIEAREITQDRLVLFGVSQAFADAVTSQHLSAPPSQGCLSELGGEQFYDRNR
jgi:hypothetical protein